MDYQTAGRTARFGTTLHGSRPALSAADASSLVGAEDGTRHWRADRLRSENSLRRVK